MVLIKRGSFWKTKQLQTFCGYTVYWVNKKEITLNKATMNSNCTHVCTKSQIHHVSLDFNPCICLVIVRSSTSYYY